MGEGGRRVPPVSRGSPSDSHGSSCLRRVVFASCLRRVCVCARAFAVQRSSARKHEEHDEPWRSPSEGANTTDHGVPVPGRQPRDALRTP